MTSPPRCVVCGGPDEAGNGCEFCPAVDGLCERCGTRVPLTPDGKVSGHKAPHCRNYCTGGGNRPRRSLSHV